VQGAQQKEKAMTTPKPRPSIVHGESHSYPVLPLRDIVVFPHMIVPPVRRPREIDPRARGGHEE